MASGLECRSVWPSRESLTSLRVTTLYATQPREAPSAASYATAPSGIYAVIVAVFCGLLLISNIAATKTITVVDGLPDFVGGGIFTDGGAFLFPLTYIVGDVLAEVYGFRQAKRAIWVGFALGALASLTFLAVGAAPPGPGYENQEAFVAVLGFVPRIVLASLTGYLAGQILNAYVVVKIKERTKERNLWARLIGSTVVGEFADTMLFCFIAFVGVFPTWGSLISYAVAGYIYKVLVEVILLPVTYAVIRAIKKREPGYAPAPSDSGATVRQMRLVVAVDDYDDAVRFYRDELGLLLDETYDGENGAKVMILSAGRATLELSNQPQINLIDTVEVGRTGVSGKYRVAFQVDDCAGVTDRLTSAGAELIAPPTETPWRSINARLRGPGGDQLTIFTELQTTEIPAPRS
jgi:queuosine precursor transporter